MSIRGTILARIPQDNGKRIRCSHDYVMVVTSEEECAGCYGKATLVLQGETDSFGFEPMYLCDACHADDGDGDHENGRDVEDKAPKEGHVWAVLECTNHDGHGEWDFFSESYRDAVVFLRSIELLAEPWCGLYPNKGVREITFAERDRIRRSISEQQRRELEEWDEWQEQEEARKAEREAEADDDAYWAERDRKAEESYELMKRVEEQEEEFVHVEVVDE